MNWSNIIRQIVAVAVASAIPVGFTTAFADSLAWSEGFGLGLFLMAIGVLIVTIIHCYRFERLYSHSPTWRSLTSR